MTLFEKRLRVDLQVARYDYYHAVDIETKYRCKQVVVMLEDMVLQAQAMNHYAESFDVFE